MREQIVHWIPLSFAILIGGVVLYRNHRIAGERRSVGQWIILLCYKMIRFLWAVVRGIDVGYLEFRRALLLTDIETENERTLGKRVKRNQAEIHFGAELRWAAEKS